MKRHSMPSAQSKRIFAGSAGARHVHPKNIRSAPMRGGIRL